jgi:hypothetical protein
VASLFLFGSLPKSSSRIRLATARHAFLAVGKLRDRLIN